LSQAGVLPGVLTAELRDLTTEHSMRASSRLKLTAAAAALLLSGVAAQADDLAIGGDQPAVGVGMICNTSDQAEQFIKLQAGGAKADAAMNAVNKQAKNPRACGVAAIAFIRDKTLDTKTVQNKLVQVVRINILAGFNGNGWDRVSNTIQYAVIEGEGESI
jgi:hypothetical protein